LLIVNEVSAIIIISVFGVLFGSLGSILVKDIEALENHHHLIISFIIPIVAIITSFFISRQTGDVQSLLDPAIKHNPYVLAISFSVFSLLPYLISLYVMRKQR
jgi:membrane protein insertase Oxa1/YidC/SpoIIIJ